MELKVEQWVYRDEAAWMRGSVLTHFVGEKVAQMKNTTGFRDLAV